MVMMNCFCGMVDRQKAFSLISSRDHCLRSSPSQISDLPRAGFESAQNLSPDFFNAKKLIKNTKNLFKALKTPKRLYGRYPTNIFLLKVNNRNTTKRYEMIKIFNNDPPERHHGRRSGGLIVNFEHISHFFYCFYS